MVKCVINNALERTWKEAVVAEVLRKTTVDPNRITQSLAQNFNLQTQIWSRSAINFVAAFDKV
jgi:L-asparaginase II